MEKAARTGGTGGPWVSCVFELGLHGNIADSVPWKQGRERTCSLVTCRTGGAGEFHSGQIEEGSAAL